MSRYARSGGGVGGAARSRSRQPGTCPFQTAETSRTDQTHATGNQRGSLCVHNSSVESVEQPQPLSPGVDESSEDLSRSHVMDWQQLFNGFAAFAAQQGGRELADVAARSHSGAPDDGRQQQQAPAAFNCGSQPQPRARTSPIGSPPVVAIYVSNNQTLSQRLIDRRDVMRQGLRKRFTLVSVRVVAVDAIRRGVSG